MTNHEDRMRNLTPHQRDLLADYVNFHKDMLGSDKLRNWENVLIMLEDYFYLLKELGIPIEPELQNVKATWEKNIIKGNKKASEEFEEILRRLVALRA